jgi:hypothetical protein
MDGIQVGQEGTSAAVIIVSKMVSVDLETPRVSEPTYSGFGEVYSPFAGLTLMGLFNANEGYDSKRRYE